MVKQVWSHIFYQVILESWDGVVIADFASAHTSVSVRTDEIGDGNPSYWETLVQMYCAVKILFNKILIVLHWEYSQGIHLYSFQISMLA